ncbi:MAG TPA: MarC family protein [Chthoniobacteraceae bacterium]|jgi:multiple antibiotic resistance protein
MHDSLLKFALKAFTTFLVVVDPIGVLPIFISPAKGQPAAERVSIVNRAAALGVAISLFFLIAGNSAFSYLGVTMHAFAISGGILLFVTAMPMLFGQAGAEAA